MSITTELARLPFALRRLSSRADARLIRAMFAVAATSLSWGAAPTQAAPTASVDRSPVAGVPFRLEVQGTAAGTEPSDPDADRAPALGIALLPPGIACPDSYALVVGDVFSRTYGWARGSSQSEPYQTSDPLTIDRPGVYTACAYFGLEGILTISADAEATIQRGVPVPVNVARPSVSSTVALDGPLNAAGVARLYGQVQSDAPEQLTFHLNEAGRSCAATATSNAGNNRFSPAVTDSVYGGPTTVAREVVLPSSPGEYRLCTYAHRAGQGGDPDLVLSSDAIPISTQLPQPSTPLSGLTPAQPAVGDGAIATDLPPITNTVFADRQPAVVCRLSAYTVRRTRSVWVRCPGASGTIGVTLTRHGQRRTYTLLVNGAGTARLRTDRVPAGTWTVRVTYRGATVALDPLRVRALPRVGA